MDGGGRRSRKRKVVPEPELRRSTRTKKARDAKPEPQETTTAKISTSTSRSYRNDKKNAHAHDSKQLHRTASASTSGNDSKSNKYKETIASQRLELDAKSELIEELKRDLREAEGVRDLLQKENRELKASQSEVTGSIGHFAQELESFKSSLPEEFREKLEELTKKLRSLQGSGSEGTGSEESGREKTASPEPESENEESGSDDESSGSEEVTKSDYENVLAHSYIYGKHLLEPEGTEGDSSASAFPVNRFRFDFDFRVNSMGEKTLPVTLKTPKRCKAVETLKKLKACLEDFFEMTQLHLHLAVSQLNNEVDLERYEQELPELPKLRVMALGGNHNGIKLTRPLYRYFGQLVSLDVVGFTGSEYFLDRYDPELHPGFPNLLHFSVRVDLDNIRKLEGIQAPSLQEIKLSTDISPHDSPPWIYFRAVHKFGKTLKVINIHHDPDFPEEYKRNLDVEKGQRLQSDYSLGTQKLHFPELAIVVIFAPLGYHLGEEEFYPLFTDLGRSLSRMPGLIDVFILFDNRDISKSEQTSELEKGQRKILGWNMWDTSETEEIRVTWGLKDRDLEWNGFPKPYLITREVLLRDRDRDWEHQPI